ncbi:MAG: T9SS type A sorting domain-containing protein [Rhodothermales bacterium]|nr:T9SS type A sorting domain-containing protein [Rhodothermales bacterium]MBO6778593.1 T9SS type A sorting domain-containing protein [Rhodothermales bacterium]
MRTLPLILLLLVATATVHAQSTGTCQRSIGEAYLDVGNVRARILNNGGLFWRGSPHVYNVPKGGPANAIFASGIWIGGQVGRQLRMAGSTYGPHEFWAGPLDDAGKPPADCSFYDRVYEVAREDVATYENSGIASPDLADWPTGLGAPTVDRWGEPVDLLHLPLAERVERRIDLRAGERPDISGDQMAWWIMNDRGNVHTRTNALPLGVEIHASAFVFSSGDVLGNTTFHTYRVFMKGDALLEDAYISVFTDPDLGNFDDDYVGSDSVLGLMYVYNSDNHDEGSAGYGDAPPATGYQFLEVPNPQTQVVRSGEESPEEQRPRLMSSMMYYSGGGGVMGDPGDARDMYNFMQARWKDGQRLTVGGNGRDFSNEPTNFFFPAMPPEYWSEFDSDNKGTARAPADRRMLATTTVFDLAPGEEVRFAFAIITSFGADNIDSVRKLKEDARIIQHFYDVGFETAEPPDAPRLTVTERNGEALLQWNYRQQDNNYLDSYQMPNEALSPRAPDRHYRLEGYRVLRFDGPADVRGQEVATFDVKNGVTRVVEGEELTYLAANGSDSGLRHHYLLQGLTNYRSYWYGVQAYAYNPYSSPRVLNGPITRVEIVPSRSVSAITPLGEQYLQESGSNMARGIGSLLAIESNENVGSSVVSANVVNDVQLTGDIYDISFVQIPGLDSTDADRLSLTVTRQDGTLAFDGSTSPLPGPPRGVDVLRFDGLSLNVTSTVAPAAVSHIEVVSNNAGRLAEPVTAAPAWLGYPTPAAQAGRQQSTTDATWMVVTGQSRLCPDLDCSPWEVFLDRTVREQGGWDRIAPWEWEIRFTERDAYAWDPWTTGGLIRVPFELWRTGIRSTGDPSDDVRMIPVVNDIDGNGVFNILLSDHPASPDPDDPFTDWFYWHLPLDESPGESGYATWLQTARQDGSAAFGPVTWGRMSLMNWNGAMGRPAADGVLNAWMPEPGTTIRLSTTASVQPGDRFVLNTSALVRPEGVQEEDYLIGVTPNPYKGASAYETSQLTDEVRFTNMPIWAKIRIYTLSGTLVRTLQKNSPDRHLPWDLRTSENLPIASGMYLVHIDTERGEQVLKLGVVKKQPTLNVF